MWGHLNIHIFPLLYIKQIYTNPVKTCPMGINKHSGQAPTYLDHIYEVMPLDEMSPHEIEKQKMPNLN